MIGSCPRSASTSFSVKRTRRLVVDEQHPSPCAALHAAGCAAGAAACAGAGSRTVATRAAPEPRSSYSTSPPCCAIDGARQHHAEAGAALARGEERRARCGASASGRCPCRCRARRASRRRRSPLRSTISTSTAARRGLERVGDQVEQRLLQAARVAVTVTRLARARERDARALGARLEHRQHVVGDRAESRPARARGPRAGARTRGSRGGCLPCARPRVDDRRAARCDLSSAALRARSCTRPLIAASGFFSSCATFEPTTRGSGARASAATSTSSRIRSSVSPMRGRRR